MDEFDVGNGGVGFVGNLLLELLNSLDDGQIDVDLEGLLFGRSLEEKLDHLKIYQILLYKVIKTFWIPIEGSVEYINYRHNISTSSHCLQRSILK